MLSAWTRAIAAVLLSCAVSACAKTAPAQPHPTGPVLLTVVTWNAHGDDGDLRRLIVDLESGRLTGDGVRDYVLLLQEFAEREGGEAIASATRPLALHVSPVRRNIGNAIASTLPLADTRTIDLPRERQPRTAAVATIRVDNEGLFVVSTHLENRLGWRRGLFGDRARARQATVLLAGLPAGFGIIGGDMNTMLGRDEPAWQALLERFPDTPDRPEDPTFRDRLVLDHLFFDLPAQWQASRRVIPDRYRSDHHPVIGEITGLR